MANEQLDLEQVIEDSVNDSLNSTDTDTTVDTEVDAHAEAASVDGAEEEALRGHDTSPDQIATPAGGGEKETPAQGEDDFAKKFGIQPNSVTGRENRIPYSRVKKIVEKNEKDTVARVTKELSEKYKNFGDYETKVKDYETRLQNVAQFEQILDNDPRTFLNMLSQHPSYAEFFKAVEQAFSGQQQQQAQPQKAQEQPYLDHSDMPQPDVQMADGSKVYSLDGLAKRDEWLARKIEEKAIAQAEARLSKRYAPIEQEWQSQQQIAKMVPIVEKQIAEARTWDKFDELEPRVVELLKADQNISLERAYVKAYQEHQVAEREKLSTDRNKIRQEVIADMKKKPTSSSAPTSTVKPGAEQAGPRSMEDIITEELRKAGLVS